MKFRIIPVLLISVPLFMAPSRNAIEIIDINEIPQKNLFNAAKIILPDRSSAYTIKDIDYMERPDPFSTDILLKFDREADRYVKDDTGKYSIYSAEYIFVKSGIGRGCASFFKPGQSVMIQSSEGLWLGSTGDLGSFNIEFRLNPAEFRQDTVLFSRTGNFSGVKKGLEIKLKNRIINVYAHNLFRAPDGRLKSISLVRGDKLTKGQWYHFSLSFNRKNGKFAKYLNGHEEDTAYMTSTGQAFSHVFTPLFGYMDDRDGTSGGTDIPLAVIGKNYNGLLDEFRISYMHFDDLRSSSDIAFEKHRDTNYMGRIPYNREGIITGPVREFPTTGTAVTDLCWDEAVPSGTFIWMEFRTSDKYFDENDIAPKWYRVTSPQKKISLMKNSEGEYLRGRYFQWRAHLVSSPQGDRAPVMKKLSIKYRPDTPPHVPMKVEVVESGDRYVVLRWRKNVEDDIGGYRVYYGIKKDTYDGIISTVNGKKITNSLTDDGYIRVKIDNAIIDENRSADTRKILIYPSLENTVLYYFSVSAYDSYKQDTVYNHESETSDHVNARPYAGSEIN